MLSYFLGYTRAEREGKEDAQELQTAPNRGEAFERFRQKQERFERKRRRLKRVLVPANVFWVMFLLIQVGQLFYVDRAITVYRQSLSICASYLAPEAVLHLESRFAQINTKGDFDGIMKDLHGIASANGLMLPEF